MQVIIKTLQGKTFPIEADPTITIAAFKEKIEQAQQFPVAQQKLIFAGKILKDDSILQEHNVKENDFLVVMVTKAKAPKPSTTPSTTQSSEASTSAVSGAAPSTSSASSSGTSTASAVSIASRPVATASSNVAENSTAPPSAMNEQMLANVQQLCEMGFPEDQVRSALTAAFGNADRAVEYLMNGIPENVARAPSVMTSSSTEAAMGGNARGSLEQLRNHPQFNSFRQLVRSNPAALPALLQQIGGQNPELLRLIHENQAQFLQMMNEDSTASSESAVAPRDPGAMPSAEQLQQMLGSLSPAQLAQIASQMGLTPEQLQDVSQMLGNLPPGAFEQFMGSVGAGSSMGASETGGNSGEHRIMLSQEEAAAVDRLCDLGFDRTEAAQAYLACDKNESLAANLLMDSMSDTLGGDSNSANDHISGNDDADDIYG